MDSEKKLLSFCLMRLALLCNPIFFSFKIKKTNNGKIINLLRNGMISENIKDLINQ
jgi:hypothetical protein